MGRYTRSSPGERQRPGWRRASGPGWLDETDTATLSSSYPLLRLPSVPVPAVAPVSRRAASYDERDDWDDVDSDEDYGGRDEDEDTWDRPPARDDTTGRRRAARPAPRARRYDSGGPAPATTTRQPRARKRENSSARPLSEVLSPQESRALARIEPSPVTRIEPSPVTRIEPSPDASTPALAAYQPPARRPRLDTRAIALSAARTARSPWSVARTLLAISAISVAIWTSLAAAGEPSQPLMSFQPGAGTHDARAIALLVQAETQGKRPDLYDSYTQFSDWWDAACSAAAMSEVLSAWGQPGATIGRMIDVMQPDISLNGGLLTPLGFQRGAAAFGYRADLSSSLSYKQLLYITNVLGLPVIVNVRISYGYYHFFSGGHFLIMTGGDSQGLTIVDSSEYYIHYLPLDTFMSMFTGRTTIVVPKDYTYHVPSM